MDVAALWGGEDEVARPCAGACAAARVRWARPGVGRNPVGEETSASLRADVEAGDGACVTE
jgi:hypothetical protein